MTVKRRAPRTLMLALALAVVTVAAGALAWACTPTANVSASGSFGAGVGAAGKPATVAVSGYSEGAAVQVRWNGASGSVLATGTGPAFTTTVTIPNVPDGVYNIVTTGPNGTVADGEVRLGTAPFKVGEPGVAAPSESPAPRAPAQNGNAGSAPAPGSSAGSTSGGNVVAPGRNSNTVSGGQAPSRAGAGAGADRRSTGTAGSAAPAAAPGVTKTSSGQTVFADSVGANVPGAAAATKRGERASSSSKAAPSKRSAEGDLWSGFSSGKARAGGLGGAVGPASGPGSALTLGLAVAGFGLVALLGGAGAAGLRRRRAARAGAGPRSAD